MGVAGYGRGSRLLTREIDQGAEQRARRAERDADRDRCAALTERIASLERDLARARRCIAELRRSKDARLTEARAEMATGDAAIRILTRIAFTPSPAQEVERG